MAVRLSPSHRSAPAPGLAPALTLALCLCLPCFVTTELHAEPSATAAAASSDYDRLIDDALREYRARHFPEARSLFARAHGQYPNARALRGLGMVEFELRNYVESVRRLRAALEHEVKPLQGSLREETAALLVRAESFVAELEIEANPMPTSITVNGMPVQLDTGGLLMLEVGDHVLEFQRTGYDVQRRRVSVQGGERELVRVEFTRYELPRTPNAALDPALAPGTARADSALLRPAQVEKRGDKPTDRAPDRPRALLKNPWLWTSVGIAAAALGTGLGFGLSGREHPTSPPLARDPVAIKVGP